MIFFLFRFPGDEGFRFELSALASRRSKQRVGRRRLLLDREMETVRCLNRLAGFEDEKLWPMQTLNFAQKSVLGHVRRAHSERAPPTSSESCQAALRQLLKKKAPSVYEAEGSPGQVVSFVRSKVSLPKGQHDPVSLLGVLPALERSQLMNFESEMLLSEEERAAVLEKGLEGDMYLDPVLSNNTQAYLGFIADLFSCNILGFTSRPKMQVGAFFVSKKNGKQRLVIDARRANRLFRTPPSTCLGSVDCYGRLEVEPGSTVFMAQEDVKDYFYRLGIEPSPGDYFALPKINVLKLREELGSLPPEVIRLVDQHDGDIYPCLKVLPMGFNWAFHLAHQAHCHLASMAVPKAPILLDRRAAPRLGTLKGSVASSMLIYADNNNHIGVESSVVNRDQQVMLEELHKHGLDTHEEMEANTLIESLGVRVNGLVGQVTTTPTRDWRLDRALEGLAFHRPFISGRELEVIVGHITIRALLNRNLMSILRHAYVFIRQTYDRRQRLWKSVAKEMQIFRGVMVLGVANICSQWDNQVLCTDACLSGYAVLESCHSSQVAADLGRNDECWRFRREDGKKWPHVQRL